MKKKISLIILGLVIIAGIIIWDIWQESDTAPSGMEEYVTGINGNVTRAEAAKMISLLNYTKEELQELERVIVYTDTTKKKWYDTYINGFYTMGLVSETEQKENTEFRPMGYLTYKELADIMKRLAIQSELDEDERNSYAEKLLKKVASIQDSKKPEEFVTHQDWFELYRFLYKKVFTKSNVSERELYIIESWENESEFEKWKTITNRGVFYGDGLNFLPFVDSKLKVICKEDEILGIEETIEEEAKISNVWIMEQKENSLTVFVNGYKKKFQTGNQLKKNIEKQVGDLTVQKGNLLKVSIKPDKIKGRVLKTGKDFIEIEGYGKKKLSEDFCIYKIYNGVEMEPANSILVGYENSEFVVVKNEICAAIMKEKVEAKTIRVLLKTNGFKDVIHASAVVTSTSDFTLTYGKKQKTYKAGEKVTIKPNSRFLKKGRIKFKSNDSDGKIKIFSMKRNEEIPAYRGSLEIDKENGGLLLINELPIEEYLYAVIPSEMPTSYGVEAQKVQAICARSYAYKQLFSNGCREYGAHVDDSPSYQVYNNVPENKVSIEAVKETYGQILKYHGTIITAYYFSTSCGHTANANEVWNSATEVPYLMGSFQGEKQDKDLDLSKEDDFKTFIKKKVYEAYEEDNPWYRWKVTLSKKEIKKVIDTTLSKRYEANPDLIQTLQEDGTYKSVPIGTVGTVKDIKITKRQTGGIITEIIITGSKNTIKVMTEYNVRTILAPLFSKVIRQDDSKVEHLSMLPSAFFCIEEKKKGDKVVGYRLSGGGYGHGVGMSQNGAKAMIDLGKSYEEVLKHFYKGAEIGVIY